MATVHGTCLVIDGVGLLLRGPSGSGKSDLALRALAWGASLVADDRVELETGSPPGLVARAPELLAGRMEVRGIGIVTVEHRACARLRAVVDLVDRDRVRRLPEPECDVLEGISLPRFALCAFDASAAARLAVIARELADRER